MASAAAIFISSLISLALTSRAPLKIPGNAKTLLIWLGKSLLPVPTTTAPAFFASSGMISGVGFAIAMTIAPLFIEETISGVTSPGPLTPIKISAPFMASASVPCLFVLLVNSAIFILSGVMPSLDLEIMPFLSHMTISFTPLESRSLAIATPAAPAPLKTTEQSLRSFLTTLSALSIAAIHTTAVPCWSSWKMGISVHALSFSSISKQRGAEISSRFTPPKLPEIS